MKLEALDSTKTLRLDKVSLTYTVGDKISRLVKEPPCKLKLSN